MEEGKRYLLMSFVIPFICHTTIPLVGHVGFLQSVSRKMFWPVGKVRLDSKLDAAPNLGLALRLLPKLSSKVGQHINVQI